MANKMSVYLLTATVVLLLLPFFIPISALTNEGEDFCALTGPFEDECVDGFDATLRELADDDHDEPLPQTYTIIALLLAVLALEMLMVPDLENFSNFSPFVALSSALFSLLAVLKLYDILRETNDGSQALLNVDILKVGLGGYMMLLGLVTAVAAGVLGLMKKDSS